MIEAEQLEREHALILLREMLRIRRFEEKCAESYSLGKIRGFLHLDIGEEAGEWEPVKDLSRNVYSMARQ
jgi:TPP-dependent pyruvate/acetoin dehydrogenase alpha subunit